MLDDRYPGMSSRWRLLSPFKRARTSLAWSMRWGIARKCGSEFHSSSTLLRISSRLFGRPTFVEVAFTRFKLVEGIGCSIAYSHRFYGGKVGDQMSEWLNHNGPNVEKMLMEWDAIPSPTSLSKLPQKK